MNINSNTANSKDWEKVTKNLKIQAYNQGDSPTSCMVVDSYKVEPGKKFDEKTESIQLKPVKI